MMLHIRFWRNSETTQTHIFQDYRIKFKTSQQNLNQCSKELNKLKEILKWQDIQKDKHLANKNQVE